MHSLKRTAASAAARRIACQRANPALIQGASSAPTHGTRAFSSVAAAASLPPLSPSRTALIFPGQGSHRCGPLVRDLESEWPSIVRPLLEEMDESLQFNLSRIMRDEVGSNAQQQLQSTELAQPSILTHSLMMWRIVQHELAMDSLKSIASVTLGHSLGEYTALVAAGSLSFAPAVKLVHTRGKAMKLAMQQQPASSRSNTSAGMAALITADTRSNDPLSLSFISSLISAAKRAHPSSQLTVANFNSPFQVVISGHNDAIGFVKDAVKKGNPASPVALKCIPLDVSGPFHSPLMQPSAVALQSALAEITFRAPSIPIVFNVNANPSSDPTLFRELLLAQLTSPVLWDPSIVRALTLEKSHIKDVLEFGPSTPLTSMLRSTATKLAKQAEESNNEDMAAREQDSGNSERARDDRPILHLPKAGVVPPSTWSDLRVCGVSSVAEMRSFLARQTRSEAVDV